MLRTHTCGELNKSHIDKEVTLCGWVHRRRDHGELIFIDIRDAYGLTQLIFDPKKNSSTHKKVHELKSEYVIQVKGVVQERPRGTINPKLSTGEIEVLASALDILNPSLTPPFEVDKKLEVSEETKLKYRYIDLRSSGMQKNIRLRHKINSSMRGFLERKNFVEIETPFLTRSTPEGARDYLVPSRLNTGKFYALPQSPQLFKQILMVSGFDRYFQIARCFRDEDLRKDRQPEFTQLDIEMSFVDEEDIFGLSENLLKEIFKDVANIEIPIPFPRLKYSEAMEKFGTDKPDTRGTKHIDENKYNFLWITDFPLFKYNVEEKRWESEHHPFTACKEEDVKLLDGDDLGRIRARSYDLVVNGAEIASGSIRIHKRDLQEKIFKIIGMSKKDRDLRFGFLMEAFKYGAPPHGGIAFGLDRFVTIFTKSSSIRDVIAFPKTQKAACTMTNAPSDIDDKQLKELHIKKVK